MASLTKEAQSKIGTQVDDAEVALEFSYRARITPWLVLQPDLQYVINPGTDPAIENALVAGVRVDITF